MKPLLSDMTAQHFAKRWSKLDRVFQQNDGFGALAGPSTLYSERGSSILLVAVHGIRHYSGAHDADLKGADLTTGGLVLFLAEELGVSSLVNLRRTQDINPHRGVTAADRQIHRALATDSQLTILDFHGMRDNADFDIALGTGNDEPTSQQNEMIEILCKELHPYRMRVNPPAYTARKDSTITRRALNRGADAVIQLEISRKLRETKSRPQESGAFAFFLLEALKRLQEISRKLDQAA